MPSGVSRDAVVLHPCVWGLMWRISCSKHKIWCVQFQKLTDIIPASCVYAQVIFCCSLKFGCCVFPGSFALLRSCVPLLGTLWTRYPPTWKWKHVEKKKRTEGRDWGIRELLQRSYPFTKREELTVSVFFSWHLNNCLDISCLMLSET